jgi:uncharacterized glyoxalase superfamily protein PhnB
LIVETKPVICPVFRYDNAPAAIEWLIRAFGFQKHADHRAPDDSVAHADLRFGTSAIGLSSSNRARADSPWARVRQGIYVRVDHPDVYHDRAKAAGAEIVTPLRDMDKGSREFSMRDLDGHMWEFGTYDMGAGTGEPSIWMEIRYRDVAAAVRWLEHAVGCQRALEVPDEHGHIMHAELRLGDAVFMLGGQLTDPEWADVRQLVHLRVEDPDAHFARARDAGAVVVREPQTAPYGARYYAVRDPEGFLWWVSNYMPTRP